MTTAGAAAERRWAVADSDSLDSLVAPPVWVILERRSVTPGAGAAAAHADAHSRALCGVADDVPYLAAFTRKNQAERFVDAGNRGEDLVAAALDSDEALVRFLEGAARLGHKYLGFDREPVGSPLLLVPLRDVLEAARRRQAQGRG